MYFLIFVAITILDQVTKGVVVRNISYNCEVEVIKNFFYLTNVRNRGAAWGILQNYRVFFISITVIVIVVMLCVMFSVKRKYTGFACAFIIGGAIGNFIDRVFMGYVIDFLDFYIGSYHFPTFNIADIFITVGAFLLIVEVFGRGKVCSYV